MGKMVSEEPLQVAEKGREAKGKGERERYTHLKRNAKRQNDCLRRHYK